ncbi:hypothetical protein NLG97_g2275 [Lecanicillium saksenae]|uniref:Uncharacterized protein n=1 Tax=Lecanicillium saksenae TaxID=468837 RepID=A0ACC1R1C0_9HYPO|nr:hypothetical protein NLG97_g2275 [Lecanicillium saksenae]
MTSLRFAAQLLLLYPLLVLGSLSALDRFSIFEQINLHQAYIDNNLTCDNAKLYASLYWPEGTFRVIDPNRDATVAGDKGIRGIYDYAHSVFPLSQWRHSVGLFQISNEPIPNFPAPPVSASPQGCERAFVYWHWRVDWKANTTGVVSTGTYSDVFEKRGQEWKLLAKVSRDDPNWPLYLFAPYITSQNETFQSSCGDTSL